MLVPLTFRRRYRQELRAYAYLWPALGLLGLLMVWPLIQVIRMSFFEVTLQQQRFVGLDNYGELLATPLFWRALLQTILFTAGSVSMHLVIGLGLALLLHSRINARLNAIDNVEVIESNLFENIRDCFDLIIANPPYLVDPLKRMYRHGGGFFGSELTLQIVRQSLDHLAPAGRRATPGWGARSSAGSIRRPAGRPG